MDFAQVFVAVVVERGYDGLTIATAQVAGEVHRGHPNALSGLERQVDVTSGINNGQYIGELRIALRLPLAVGSALADGYKAMDTLLQALHGELAANVSVGAQPLGAVAAQNDQIASLVDAGDAHVPIGADTRPVDVVGEEHVALPNLPVVDRQLRQHFGRRNVVGTLHADDGILTHVIGIGRDACADAAIIVGSKHVNAEVAVAHAAPSPVDVVEAVEVVAIEHKGMGATRVGTGKGNRVAAGNLAIEQVVPGSSGVVATTFNARVIVVAKVVDERFHALGEAGTRRRTIAHLATHAYPVHELGNGLLLSLGFGTDIVVGHVFPLDDGTCGDVAQLHTLLALGGRIGQCIAWNHAKRLLGIAVVGHHLGNGRGHATRGAEVALRAILAIVARAQQVVGMALVPERLEQGGHRTAGLLVATGSLD